MQLLTDLSRWMSVWVHSASTSASMVVAWSTPARPSSLSTMLLRVEQLLERRRSLLCGLKLACPPICSGGVHRGGVIMRGEATRPEDSASAPSWLDERVRRWLVWTERRSALGGMAMSKNAKLREKQREVSMGRSGFR